ncbi:hypothetical protein QR680_009705 [Steinernema hermaphroditum]|uniref:Flavin-containing monooxygenase n=1 Tax=Steinernema hermaphroditum TaxID=289476 RepID=A0AA39INT7_9BILA|nr:hypothetical protein QR680_009705 [Steinernema hermaphroditum]
MSRRVAVIGGGAAGLLTARKCLEDGAFRVTLFEQSGNVGGTWIYSPETNSHSSLYETMSTNLPKEVMHYPGVPFSHDSGDESFVPHQVVRKYLEEYAANLVEVIKFHHEVVNVRRMGSTWRVSAKTPSGSTETESFDVVFVCNGHFSDPAYPEVKHSFSGRSLHSHDYRRPQEFHGATVVIVGAGNSGMDISLQVATEAKKVYLLHRRAPMYSVLPENVEERKALVDFTEDGRDLFLEDGSFISDADAVIFCTGYRYAFPFLEEGIVEMKHRKTFIEPLHLHFVHRKFPTSLFFVGLPLHVVPFIAFDYQVRFALSLIHGTGVLDEDVMAKFEETRGSLLEEKFGERKECHYVGKTQWDLYRAYAELGNFEYNTPDQIIELYRTTTMERAKNVLTYKKMRFSHS